MGSVPEGFVPRPVASAADAAAYVEDYLGQLGLAGVAVARVVSLPEVHWVYVSEREGGHPAFVLSVRPGGTIAARAFPAMAPEMMWNQKYGHRARPDLSALVERVSLESAAGLVRQSLPADSGLRPGRGAAYYGYLLYPLCEGERFAGEAAVNAADGAVVWKRFQEPPLIWSPSTPPRGFCN